MGGFFFAGGKNWGFLGDFVRGGEMGLGAGYDVGVHIRERGYEQNVSVGFFFLS